MRTLRFLCFASLTAILLLSGTHDQGKAETLPTAEDQQLSIPSGNISSGVIVITMYAVDNDG